MRTRFCWLGVVLALGMAFAPATAQAQLGDVPTAPGSMTVPWPFGRPRYDQGGWYLGGEFLYWRQTNTMGNQPLAFRGLVDFDGSIGQALGLGNTPGQFIGSHSNALDVNYVSGPNNYTPGFNFTTGYRFSDGIALEMRWIHLFDTRYAATASLVPATSPGANLQETFLTSPVYNFSPAYVGPGNVTGVGNATAIVGIWNASSLQTIQFVQRFDQWELTMRVPMHESECWRTYGIFGPRLVSMWERFSWRVVSAEADGSTPPEDIAQYSNVSSNRLYGGHLGVGNEWFMGDTPIGAFSVSLDVQAALFIDFFKGRPKYELSDKSTAASHPRNLYSFVPEVQGSLNMWWYPYEGIVCRFGYEVSAFFNTYSSPRPVDFNFGSITPAYERTFRMFDGFNMGVGIVF